MATLKVMLCCGAGMSSGFLASNARKYAKKNKLRLPIVAVVNKCDEMAPTRFKILVDKTENLLYNIKDV